MDEFLQEYNKNYHLIYIDLFNRCITKIPFDKIMIHYGISGGNSYNITVHDTLPSAFNFLGCNAIVLLYEDQNKHIFEREYKLLQLGKYHKHGITHENKIIKLPIGEYRGIH